MSLVLLLIVMSLLLSEGEVSSFFIGIGFGGMVIYFVRQLICAHTWWNSGETFGLVGWIILFLLKILLFSLITPIVLLWSLVRSVIWLIRIAQLQKLEDCRTDFVYCELVKITRAVHSSEPNGWDPQIQ
jgi:multisubunit Na+/H+ antiporter MnhE subunit